MHTDSVKSSVELDTLLYASCKCGPYQRMFKEHRPDMAATHYGFISPCGNEVKLLISNGDYNEIGFRQASLEIERQKCKNEQA